MKPATLLSMFFSAVFASLTLCFIWYGIVDHEPPVTITAARATIVDPKTGILEITLDEHWNRYCHGRLYGFIHDKYSFGIDPVELSPDGFGGAMPSDGRVTRTFPVEIKDYFWHEKDGFTYRAELRFRCNALQGTLFPQIIVSSPDVVIPHS